MLAGYHHWWLYGSDQSFDRESFSGLCLQTQRTPEEVLAHVVPPSAAPAAFTLSNPVQLVAWSPVS